MRFVNKAAVKEFSGSKYRDRQTEQRNCVKNHILPCIFKAAKAYEEHIMGNKLFEGSGKRDNGEGKHYMWTPILGGIGQVPKRRRRNSRLSTDQVQETICDVSDDDTVLDDTMTDRYPPRVPACPSFHVGEGVQQPVFVEDVYQQSRVLLAPVAASDHCTNMLTLQELNIHYVGSARNSSFDQASHGLHAVERHIDIKPQQQTMSEQGHMQPYSVVPYNQPIQYPAEAVSNGQTSQPMGGYHYGPISSFSAAPISTSFHVYSGASPGQNVIDMSTAQGTFYKQNAFLPTSTSFPSTPEGLHMISNSFNPEYLPGY